MYLLVVRNNTHIIDLEQTIPMLRRALAAMRHTTQQRGKVGLAACGSQHPGKAPHIPEALFLLKIKQNLLLIRRVSKLQIPIIAIVNTDIDPSGIKYPIPANDASRPGVYKELVLRAAAGVELAKWILAPKTEGTRNDQC